MFTIQKQPQSAASKAPWRRAISDRRHKNQVPGQLRILLQAARGYTGQCASLNSSLGVFYCIV
jgi:hypothetical protein